MSNINELVDEIMEVEEPGNEATAVDAEELIDELQGKEPEKQEKPAAPEPEKKEPEKAPATSRKAELEAALNELAEDGWTREEIKELCQDEQVKADVRAGKSLMRAANAWERRQKQQSAASGKRSVPTVTAAAAAGVKDRNRIEDMSDKEFEEFSRRATQAAMSGKKVKIR